MTIDYIYYEINVSEILDFRSNTCWDFYYQTYYQYYKRVLGY